MPQASDLIQSFLSGLSEFLQTINPSGHAAETITVAITQTGGNSNTWVADDNFILTGVAMNASASSDMVLSLDATPPGGTGLFQAANKSYRGTILAAARAITVNYNFPPMRVRIPKGARVTLANGSVNGGCAVLVLEKI